MNRWHTWISSTIAHWYSQVTSAISTVTAVCFAPSISSLSCPVIRLQGIFALFNLFDTSHASSLRGPQYTPEKMQRFSVNQFLGLSWQNPTQPNPPTPHRWFFHAEYMGFLHGTKPRTRTSDTTEDIPEELDCSCFSAWYVLPLFVGPTCKKTFLFFLRAFGYHVWGQL